MQGLDPEFAHCVEVLLSAKGLWEEVWVVCCVARAARHFGDAKTAHFCADLAFCLFAYARMHRAVSGTVSIVAKFADTAENEMLQVWLV